MPWARHRRNASSDLIVSCHRATVQTKALDGYPTPFRLDRPLHIQTCLSLHHQTQMNLFRMARNLIQITKIQLQPFPSDTFAQQTYHIISPFACILSSPQPPHFGTCYAIGSQEKNRMTDFQLWPSIIFRGVERYFVMITYDQPTDLLQSLWMSFFDLSSFLGV